MKESEVEYEIARFDLWFKRGMSHTKANYTMREDGDVQIVNTGLTVSLQVESI